MIEANGARSSTGAHRVAGGGCVPVPAGRRAVPWPSPGGAIGMTGLTVIVWSVLGAALTVVPAAGQLRFSDDFEGDLTGWVLVGAHAIRTVESGDPRHGRVLSLMPDGDVYALVRGSEEWGALRVEGDVLFPDDVNNYLGMIYNYTRTGRRVDFGDIYIKGNGSYIRVNPHRDGNVGRTLYEEYRTPLTGTAAIRIGEWQRFKVEIVGHASHVYVGDMTTPQVTFDDLELAAGAVGVQPRSIGGSVWVDNVRVTSIAGFSYDGPPRPNRPYQPESLLTRWDVIGPLTEHDDAVERLHAGTEGRWRPWTTDGRGAVITGAVTDWVGLRTVAYFRTTIRAAEHRAAVLHVSTVDDLAVWVNGRFTGGFVSRQALAWYDFWINPDHAGRRVRLALEPGDNHVVIRVRGGVYASGGFFARLER